MTALLATARLITNSLRLDALNVNLPGDVDWPPIEAIGGWPALLTHADAHSLTPLLFATWREADILDQVPRESRERMAKTLRDNALRQANVCAELLEIDSILDAAGVPHIVLKGWPLAERLYADPAHRVIYDHDFLVPADKAEIGHQALLAAGFRRLPAKDEWIEKHLPSVWRNDGYQWNGYLFDPHYPRPVELHLQLWETGWRGLGVRPLPNIWADGQTVVVAGRPMLTLSHENTAIHLSMHFAGHLIEREARLNQLLDLARFVHQVPDLNWDKITGRAAAAGVGRFLFASLFLAHEIFASPLPPAPAWKELEREAPLAFREWLIENGVEDVLTSSCRQRRKGQDYQLTFLAARSIFERLGIIRFAALPPAGQLMVKYNLRHRWLTLLLYPRYLAERLGAYGRALLTKN